GVKGSAVPALFFIAFQCDLKLLFDANKIVLAPLRTLIGAIAATPAWATILPALSFPFTIEATMKVLRSPISSRLRLLPLALTAFLCAANVMPAQTLSPQLFSGLRWRLVGPFRAGRVVAVSGVPGTGGTFYFGGVDGGVWKTTDAGTGWRRMCDHEPVASIGALAVAPSDPNVIYAGTGESDIRSDLSSGDGVY